MTRSACFTLAGLVLLAALALAVPHPARDGAAQHGASANATTSAGQPAPPVRPRARPTRPGAAHKHLGSQDAARHAARTFVRAFARYEAGLPAPALARAASRRLAAELLAHPPRHTGRRRPARLRSLRPIGAGAFTAVLEDHRGRRPLTVVLDRGRRRVTQLVP